MRNKLFNIGIPLALIAVIVAIVILGINKYTTTAQDNAVAVTVPVELKASGTTKGSSIGMILTIGNEAAEGSQWNQAASGAQVAAERFTRGGADINLVTEDDRGSEDGARKAVQALADKKVSGIIIATSGPHVQAAIDAASVLKIPVILPYTQALGDSWSLQPASSVVTEKVRSATSQVSRVIRLDQQGFVSLDVPAENTISVGAETNTDQLAQNLAKQTKDATKSYAVVINADAYLQGRIMRSLQSNAINAQVYLSSEATSPAFSQTLMKDQQVSTVDAQSPGIATGDSVALRPDGQGRSMSAYLQTVKILSDSDQSTNALGDQKFKDVAGAADSRAHDAFVALVRAMEKADSHDPQKVHDAISTMALSASDGITGPSYNFAQQQVPQDSSVTMLSATVGDIEMRRSTTDTSPAVVWFAQS